MSIIPLPYSEFKYARRRRSVLRVTRYAWSPSSAMSRHPSLRRDLGQRTIALMCSSSR